MSASTPTTDMPYRVPGRTGERVSAIGLGGWHPRPRVSWTNHCAGSEPTGSTSCSHGDAPELAG
jgi:hypothetical protein